MTTFTSKSVYLPQVLFRSVHLQGCTLSRQTGCGEYQLKLAHEHRVKLRGRTRAGIPAGVMTPTGTELASQGEWIQEHVGFNDIICAFPRLNDDSFIV